METSLKTGFAQIFSCCPKNLSRPKFGGGGLQPPSPPRPVRLWLLMFNDLLDILEGVFPTKNDFAKIFNKILYSPKCY